MNFPEIYKCVQRPVGPYDAGQFEMRYYQDSGHTESVCRLTLTIIEGMRRLALRNKAIATPLDLFVVVSYARPAASYSSRFPITELLLIFSGSSIERPKMTRFFYPHRNSMDYQSRSSNESIVSIQCPLGRDRVEERVYSGLSGMQDMLGRLLEDHQR
jgi:hypothetical protein